MSALTLRAEGLSWSETAALLGYPTRRGESAARQLFVRAVRPWLAANPAVVARFGLVGCSSGGPQGGHRGCSCGGVGWLYADGGRVL